MPLSSTLTVLNVPGVRVSVYSNDHPPPHVHAVRRDGARAKFELNCPDGPVTLIEKAGFGIAEISDVGGAIAEHLPAICAILRQVHG